MIRRPLVACGVAALAALITSGCSTISENKTAATVNDHELSVDEFETIARDVGQPDAHDEIPGDVARQVLTVWVQGQLLTDALEANGQQIQQDDRDAAQAQLEGAYGDQWNSFDAKTQEFLIESIAANEALVSDEDVRAIYEQGVSTSNVVCLRFILAPDQAAADAIKAELDSGQAFADVADAHPPAGSDPATNPPGGVLTNPDNGSECIAADALAAEFSEPLSSTPIGESTDAILFQGQYVFFLQRPFDEVTDDAHALIAPTVNDDARDAIVVNADARVDSRYGMWDPESGQVVAAR